MSSKLTPRQQRFVSEYVRAPNGAQAAIRAGYSPSRASPTAARLVADGKIAAAIARGQQRLAERNEISADRVIREYARIAFADVRSSASWGNTGVTLRPSDELTEDEAAAVAEVTQTRHGIRVRMHNKISALDALAKHLGLLGASGVHVDARSVNVELASLSDDELRALIRGVVAQGALPEESDGGVERWEDNENLR